MGGIDAFISDRQVLTRWDIHDYSGRVNFTAQNQNISHVTCPSLISIKKIRRFDLKTDSKLKCLSIGLRLDRLICSTNFVLIFNHRKRPPEFTFERTFLFVQSFYNVNGIINRMILDDLFKLIHLSGGYSLRHKDTIHWFISGFKYRLIKA